MPDLQPKDLIYVEELLSEGKIEGTLDIIKKFEKSEAITPKDRLKILILRGKIAILQNRFIDAVEFGDLAYLLSQKIGSDFEAIEALILKAMGRLGKPDEALDYIFEAEKRLNSLSERSTSNLSNLKLGILFTRVNTYCTKGDLNKSLELALGGLEIGKKFKRKLYIARFLDSIQRIYSRKAEYNTALEYAMESLEIYKQIGHQGNISFSLSNVGWTYYLKGDLNQALRFSNESMSIKDVSEFIKIQNKIILGGIYREKGELNKALEYYKQALEIGKELETFYIASNLTNIGRVYRLQGDLDQAEKYLKQSLVLFENSFPLLYLLLISLDRNSYKEAQLYLMHLKELAEKNNAKIIKQAYKIGKAFILKESNRMHDHVEAAGLFRKIIEDEIVYLRFHVLSIVSLCDLHLEELSMYNNPEIFEEINPRIRQLLKIAEENHSFLFLSETYLLRGKVALIKFNLGGARQYLTKAQQIADEHDLTLLARKISYEHDKLVEELETWQNFRKSQVSISKRIKLASIDGVIDRMQEKRALKPPEMVDEQSTLLLIIAEGGVLVFSYPFTDKWKQDETLFSSFLSAFTSFSDEFFSEGLDRAKFGQHTVLMESVGSFSVCYLYEGQTYAAKQKLSKFAEAIQNTNSIWQILDKFYKTNQILEIKDNPPLENLITEIFLS